MILNYINRLFSLLYYILHVVAYKALNFRAVLRFSVRVNGKKFISIDKGTSIQRGGWLLALKIDSSEPELIIGKNCAIGDFCHIAAVRRIHIHDDVLIANNVYISDNLHSYKDVKTPIIQQAVIFKSVVIIKSGAWIGENACIIGASIGKNSVVGANSVVTTDVPDYCIAVGSPAKIIKKYNFENLQWEKVS